MKSKLVSEGAWNSFDIGGPQELKLAVTYFEQNKFSRIIGNSSVPVFVYPFKLEESGLGNVLGRYFEAICNAKQIGLHFITLPPPANHSSKNRNSDGTDFFKYFLIDKCHDGPVDLGLGSDTSRKEVIGKSKLQIMKEFPWESPDLCWPQELPLIKRLMRESLDAYMSSNYTTPGINVSNGDMMMHHTDRPRYYQHLTMPVEHFEEFYNWVNATGSTANKTNRPNGVVPFISDATIVIRCNEILAMEDEVIYGFLNFNTYLMIIPAEARHIYIHTEPHSYNSNIHSDRACTRLISELKMFLAQYYPLAFIGVIRGKQFDTMVRLAYSPVVISVASSFSFWPALANDVGEVYFHLTKLLMQARPRFLADNFYWISYPKHMNFGGKYSASKDGDIDKIVAELKSLTPRPRCTGAHYHDSLCKRIAQTTETKTKS